MRRKGCRRRSFCRSAIGGSASALLLTRPRCGQRPRCTEAPGGRPAPRRVQSPAGPSACGRIAATVGEERAWSQETWTVPRVTSHPLRSSPHPQVVALLPGGTDLLRGMPFEHHLGPRAASRSPACRV